MIIIIIMIIVKSVSGAHLHVQCSHVITIHRKNKNSKFDMNTKKKGFLIRNKYISNTDNKRMVNGEFEFWLPI